MSKATTQWMGRLSVAAAGMLVATVSQAGLIDFSSSGWSGASGQSSFSVDGVTASSSPWGTKLSQGSQGLGIQHWLDSEPDEIDGLEVLSIDLGSPTQIEGFTLSNLYTNEDCGFWSCDEYGKYRLDGGSWQSFSAMDASGMLSVSSNTTAQTLEFGFGYEPSLYSEFSLHSITTVDVPEPALLGLLGLSLAGLGLARRRRR